MALVYKFILVETCVCMLFSMSSSFSVIRLNGSLVCVVGFGCCDDLMLFVNFYTTCM